MGGVPPTENRKPFISHRPISHRPQPQGNIPPHHAIHCHQTPASSQYCSEFPPGVTKKKKEEGGRWVGAQIHIRAVSLYCVYKKPECPEK